MKGMMGWRDGGIGRGGGEDGGDLGLARAGF